MSHRFTIPFLCVALLLGLSRVSNAQFNKAYDESYKPLLGLADELKKQAELDAASRNYDDIRSLAEKYYGLLDKLTSNLDNIGRTFQESANKDWASDTKRHAVDGARKARDFASKLKDKAASKADCTAELKDLREVLTDASDAFRDLWKAHEARADKLDAAFSSKREDWWNQTHDMRRDIAAGWDKYTALLDREKAIEEKRNDTSKAYRSILDELARAQTDWQDTVRRKDSDPGDERSKYEKWGKFIDLETRASKLVDSLSSDVKDAQKATTDAYSDYQKAQDNFLKDSLKCDSSYSKEVLPRHKELVDFLNEYKRMSL